MEPPPAPKAGLSLQQKPPSSQPQPAKSHRPASLAQFIARVNLEGGFRNLSEAKLREEVRRRQNRDAAQDDDDTAMDDAEDDDDSSEEEANVEEAEKDPGIARFEIMRQVETAHNAAMLTLDLVSLYISKETPGQATATLSQTLRERAGIGTIGSTLVSAANITPAKEKDNSTVAVGWTLGDIEQACETATKAYVDLENEIGLEETYWNDIVAATEHGWAVCRLPQAKHILGVRYGFNEAAANFKNDSLAPMLRGDDGHAKLDLDRVGGSRLRIEVSLTEGGDLLSRSCVSLPFTSNIGLESKVLEARNTMFSQELWHELHKEAHTLAGYNVRTEGDAIVYDSPTGQTIELRLVTADEDAQDLFIGDSLPLVDGVHLCLHMLLLHVHRWTQMMRLRAMAPTLSRSRVVAPTHLLRPIIARLVHEKNMADTTSFVADLVKVLNAAGVTNSSFVLTASAFPAPPPSSAVDARPQLGPPPARGRAAAASRTSGAVRSDAPFALGASLLAPIDFQLELDFAPDCPVTLRGRTFLTPQTATQYQVNLNPLPPAVPGGAPRPNPVRAVCPPADVPYSDLPGLTYYLRVALTRALTEHFLPVVQRRAAEKAAARAARGGSGDGDDAGVQWGRHLRGSSIRDIDDEETAIRFDVIETKGGRPSLAVRMDYPAGSDVVGGVQEAWTWQADGKGTADKQGAKMEGLILAVVDKVAMYEDDQMPEVPL